MFLFTVMEISQKSHISLLQTSQSSPKSWKIMFAKYIVYTVFISYWVIVNGIRGNIARVRGNIAWIREESSIGPNKCNIPWCSMKYSHPIWSIPFYFLFSNSDEISQWKSLQDWTCSHFIVKLHAFQHWKACNPLLSCMQWLMSKRRHKIWHNSEQKFSTVA